MQNSISEISHTHCKWPKIFSHINNWYYCPLTNVFLNIFSTYLLTWILLQLSRDLNTLSLTPYTLILYKKNCLLYLKYCVRRKWWCIQTIILILNKNSKPKNFQTNYNKLLIKMSIQVSDTETHFAHYLLPVLWTK